MSKEKKFRVGDLVFAKLRGYPPWPAIVNKFANKKYGVIFYGTGETANIKPEDLYLYSQHKEKFTTEKNLKRSKFRKAIHEADAVFGGEKSSASAETGGGISKLEKNAAINAKKIETDVKQSVSGANSRPKEVVAISVEQAFQRLSEELRECANCGRVDVDRCKDLLQQLRELELSKMMLLRNPHCVHIIRQVLLKIEFIRREALFVFQDIEKFFPMPDGQFFFETFSDEVNIFEQCTKHKREAVRRKMTEATYMRLRTNALRQKTENGSDFIQDAENKSEVDGH